jgi:hypothetical protein
VVDEPFLAEKLSGAVGDEVAQGHGQFIEPINHFVLIREQLA